MNIQKNLACLYHNFMSQLKKLRDEMVQARKRRDYVAADRIKQQMKKLKRTNHANTT